MSRRRASIQTLRRAGGPEPPPGPRRGDHGFEPERIADDHGAPRPPQRADRLLRRGLARLVHEQPAEGPAPGDGRRSTSIFPSARSGRVRGSSALCSSHPVSHRSSCGPGARVCLTAQAQEDDVALSLIRRPSSSTVKHGAVAGPPVEVLLGLRYAERLRQDVAHLVDGEDPGVHGVLPHGVGAGRRPADGGTRFPGRRQSGGRGPNRAAPYHLLT
ncbi:hypothetical protein H340_22121 [Streptomyces mobaraensis NBRC 13819 = DSM 40847]|uniref:Uncharacterized protein n=1 Tax=Streptomyces mobaraensis (strain ATCC 29032 / DSM 40847 / JCM 4168 / NBRC 13819 / NCIMB 11159 / IPCR 16-22) TaxID=1223523 RepID=M3AXG6_STRM1|nr:hypothetical protein H340_22121 [Streptomyces mobaraensis NBRC 13819 = DSM 40847]